MYQARTQPCIMYGPFRWNCATAWNTENDKSVMYYLLIDLRNQNTIIWKFDFCASNPKTRPKFGPLVQPFRPTIITCYMLTSFFVNDECSTIKVGDTRCISLARLVA